MEWPVLNGLQLLEASGYRADADSTLSSADLHVTLLYVGKVTDVVLELQKLGAPRSEHFVEDLTARLGDLPGDQVQVARATGTARLEFGGVAHDVLLLEVSSSMLLARKAAWDALVGALAHAGISDPEEFVWESRAINAPTRGWNPHVTIARGNAVGEGSGGLRSVGDVLLGPARLHRSSE